MSKTCKNSYCPYYPCCPGVLEIRESLREDCSLSGLSEKSKRIVLGVLVRVCIERLGCLVHKI